MRATGDAIQSETSRVIGGTQPKRKPAVWVASPVVRVGEFTSEHSARNALCVEGKLTDLRAVKSLDAVFEAGPSSGCPHHTLSPVTRISHGRFLPGDGNSPDSSGAFYPLSDVPPVAPRPGCFAFELKQPGRPDNSRHDIAKGLPATRVVASFVHAINLGMEQANDRAENHAKKSRNPDDRHR